VLFFFILQSLLVNFNLFNQKWLKRYHYSDIVSGGFIIWDRSIAQKYQYTDTFWGLWEGLGEGGD
jgi:hypothetical protein